MNELHKSKLIEEKLNRKLSLILRPSAYNPTVFTLINGTDAVVGELFSQYVCNKMKNNWAAADAPSDIQQGMIRFDTDDLRWYGYDGTSYQKFGAPRHFFSCYLGSNQLNIVDQTWTKILYDTIIYDQDGGGLSANGYTVTENGIYLIIVSADWVATANGMYGVAIYIDAVMKAFNFRHGEAAEDYTTPVAIKPLEVNSGQTIYGYAYQKTGGNTPDIMGLETGTFMTIYRVGDKIN